MKNKIHGGSSVRMSPYCNMLVTRRSGIAFLLPIILAAHIHKIVAIPDACTDLNNEIERNILQQEAFKLECFVDVLQAENNESVMFQCLKNNHELISTDQEQRILVNNPSLWFLPALMSDTGNYTCYLWNATICIMEVFQIQVFQLPPNQCFHRDCLQPPLTESPATLYISCTDDYPWTTLRWYKNCNPIKIDNEKYFMLNNRLHIKNADSEDDGMYTCSLEFVHFGRRFHVTQTMELKIKLTKLIQPELISPKNNTIQARLGSELNVTCEAHLGSGNLQMYGLSWMNIPKDNLRIKQGPELSKKGTGQGLIIRRTLIISKINEEDFETKFHCVAHNSLGYENAFLKLSRQSSDGTYDVITVFIPLIFGFLACVTMYVIFKVEIVLWYRDSFISPNIIHDGKKFDAYVIYPRSENKGSLDKRNANYFALHILPQVLEEKYGYKLFIYGRDELPGQAAAEVIENSIRSSRRLIIILTRKPSADDQAYSGFERQVGLFEALIRNEIKVILIELEKFDCLNDFPVSLRHIILKKGTIKWKSPETSKPNAACSRFWKQVRYKMPARNKTCWWNFYDSASHKMKADV